MAIDPRGLTFEEWSAYTAPDIVQFGYVPVQGVADDWQSWAQAALRAPEIAGQNVPDPRGFATWQEWALRLNDGLRSLGL